MNLRIAQEPDLSPDAFIDILQRSTLAARRPVEDRQIIAGMLRSADLILTARNEAGEVVGIARALSDFHYCTYLSDLGVDTRYQRQGIGRRLLEATHAAAGLHTTLILLAAPDARTYYPHIGMEPHDSCWIRRNDL
jgi:ribosomal protein S18 acetylase RimI-like enzyme